jgi:hypothetical protein
MKINEVILEGEILEGAGIQKWVSSLRPELKGGAYFNTNADWLKASQAKPGSWLHTAAMNSPQHPDTGFKWNTKANRRKISTAVKGGIKGAQKYAQKYKDKEPFVPKVKDNVDIYKNVRYPTN